MVFLASVGTSLALGKVDRGEKSPVGGKLTSIRRVEFEGKVIMGRTSDSRKRLIDAGHDLIWSTSYGSVTIEAICERAHVQKAHFTISSIPRPT